MALRADSGLGWMSRHEIVYQAIILSVLNG